MGRSMGGGVVYKALEMSPGLVDAAAVWAPVSSLEADNFNRFVRRDPPATRRRQSERRYGPRRAGSCRFWREISARTYFDRITEPLLIVQGGRDDTCPPRWARRRTARSGRPGSRPDWRGTTTRGTPSARASSPPWTAPSASSTGSWPAESGLRARCRRARAAKISPRPAPPSAAAGHARPRPGSARCRWWPTGPLIQVCGRPGRAGDRLGYVATTWSARTTHTCRSGTSVSAAPPLAGVWSSTIVPVWAMPDRGGRHHGVDAVELGGGRVRRRRPRPAPPNDSPGGTTTVRRPASTSAHRGSASPSGCAARPRWRGTPPPARRTGRARPRRPHPTPGGSRRGHLRRPRAPDASAVAHRRRGSPRRALTIASPASPAAGALPPGAEGLLRRARAGRGHRSRPPPVRAPGRVAAARRAGSRGRRRARPGRRGRAPSDRGQPAGRPTSSRRPSSPRPPAWAPAGACRLGARPPPALAGRPAPTGCRSAPGRPRSRRRTGRRRRAASRPVVLADPAQQRVEDRTDRAGVDRAVGVTAGPLVDRAHVEAGRATDAPQRLPADLVGQRPGAAVVEQHDVHLLRAVAGGDARPDRGVGVHPLPRSTTAAAAGGTRRGPPRSARPSRCPPPRPAPRAG